MKKIFIKKLKGFTEHLFLRRTHSKIGAGFTHTQILNILSSALNYVKNLFNSPLTKSNLKVKFVGGFTRTQIFNIYANMLNYTKNFFSLHLTKSKVRVKFVGGFTRTQIFIKKCFGYFRGMLEASFLRKSRGSVKFVGGFTRTQIFIKKCFCYLRSQFESKIIMDKGRHVKFVGGFTLLETLVAITILLLTIVGPMTIASKGYLAAVYARDEITAFYLAQEAIEYLRYKRDTKILLDCYGVNTTNCKDKSKWFEIPTNNGYMSGCIAKDNGNSNGSGNNNDKDSCYIDYLDNFDLCDKQEGCPPLKFDADSGTYFYPVDPDSLPDSKFTRTIIMTEVDTDDNEVEIEVEIRWVSGALLGATKTFTIHENLFNTQRQ